MSLSRPVVGGPGRSVRSHERSLSGETLALPGAADTVGRPTESLATSQSGAPGLAESGGDDFAPFLDWAKSVPRAALQPEYLARWLLAAATPGNDSAHLVTLTYDPRRLRSARHPGLSRTRVGVQAFRRDVAEWSDRLRAACPTADVLLGGEPHRNDALHGHALVLAPPEFRYAPIQAWWQAEHGGNRWDRVRRPLAAGAYAGKYAVKELALVGVAFRGQRLVVT